MRPLTYLLVATTMCLSREPMLVPIDELVRLPHDELARWRILPRKLGQVRFEPLVTAWVRSR